MQLQLPGTERVNFLQVSPERYRISIRQN